MIIVIFFLLVFFIGIAAAYISTFLLFISALHEQGFPQDAVLEAKTNFFLLFQNEPEKTQKTFLDADSVSKKIQPYSTVSDWAAYYTEVEQHISESKEKEITFLEG